MGANENYIDGFKSTSNSWNQEKESMIGNKGDVDYYEVGTYPVGYIYECKRCMQARGLEHFLADTLLCSDQEHEHHYIFQCCNMTSAS